MGFYAMMAVALLFLGQIQGLLRSVFAMLIPKGSESTFFALYAITDRGSNVIGTVVTAVVHNATGSYQHVFWYLVFAFGAAMVLLTQVDIAAGKEEAEHSFTPKKRQLTRALTKAVGRRAKLEEEETPGDRA
jgi:UMF1 family MFS transporter